MAKIGILIFSKKISRRESAKRQFFDALPYVGLRHIISEIDLSQHSIDFCDASNLNDYDYALYSLISPLDQKNIIYNLRWIKNRSKVKVIVGGAGLTNIRLISNLIDIAVFGRAEGQINDIISDKMLPNVWRKEDDPHISKKYEYRQALYLLPQESNVGCPNKCHFCQYSYTHKLFKKTDRYDSESNLLYSGSEDDFRHLKITDGRHHISAIDGVSEYSRKRVNKLILNKDITKKMREINDNEINTRQSLKLYTICGYPWEYPGREYLTELEDVFRKGDAAKKRNNVNVFLLFTPFSPEPLTPMQRMKPDLKTNWRDELTKKRPYILYDGNNTKVYIHQYILTNYALLERVLINRGWEKHRELFDKLLFTPKFQKLRVNEKMWNLNHQKMLNDSIFGVIKEDQELATDFLIPVFDFKQIEKDFLNHER